MYVRSDLGILIEHAYCSLDELTQAKYNTTYVIASSGLSADVGMLE